MRDLIRLLENISEPLAEMRTDSEEFERLDWADKWLAKYTYEALDKWPSRDVLETLAERYPIDKPMVIYRGMNFSTKEQWEEFEKDLQAGELIFGGISSWGRNGDNVEQFAVTRPSYFLDIDTMREYGAARNQREFVSGYRGVVLKTTVEPGLGIDVNKSRLGHEDEIILFPGTHKVEVHRHLKRYRDTLDDGDTTIDDVMVGTSDGKYDQGFREFVRHHHITDLSEKTRHHLFLKARAELPEGKNPSDVTVDIREPARWDKPGTPTEGYVYYNREYFEHGYRGGWTKADDAICRKEAKMVVLKIIQGINANPSVIFNLRGVKELAEYSGMADRYLQAMKAHIGRSYRALEAEGRELNAKKWDDQWAFRSAIQKHGERVAKVLQQLG